jgi:acetyl esterase/lipase
MTSLKIDLELRKALEGTTERLPRPILPEHIRGMQERSARMAPSDDELSRDGTIVVADRIVPGSGDRPDLPALVLRRSGHVQLLPGIVYIHGGGMISGNRRSYIEGPLDWVVELNVVAVSLEYRLPPDHPHPAPVEDCFAGLEWAFEHAGELGIDPGRMLLAGSSAGGGLAAAVALMARDRGGPPLAAQLLIAPMLDDRETPTSRLLEGEGAWDYQSNITGWTALLGERRGSPDVSPYAAPARATDLSNLPPAYVDVGALDGFRHQDVDYVTRIWEAGGEAELHVWPGAYHGFSSLSPHASVSRSAWAARSDWLRRILARSGAAIGRPQRDEAPTAP